MTMKPLKPYHEHPLLQNYSDTIDGGKFTWHRSFNWYCPVCNCGIWGPPFEIGEYVVTNSYRYKRGRLWRVYTRAVWESDYPRDGLFVFERPRKRDAIKHARELDRARKRLLRAIETGDAKMLADIHRDVKRVQREEAS